MHILVKGVCSTGASCRVARAQIWTKIVKISKKYNVFGNVFGALAGPKLATCIFIIFALRLLRAQKRFMEIVKTPIKYMVLGSFLLSKSACTNAMCRDASSQEVAKVMKNSRKYAFFVYSVDALAGFKWPR